MTNPGQEAELARRLAILMSGEAGTVKIPMDLAQNVVDALSRAQDAAKTHAERMYAAGENAKRVYARARAEAMEEAAQIADSYRCGCCGMDGKAAAAIRALSQSPQPESGSDLITRHQAHLKAWENKLSAQSDFEREVTQDELDDCYQRGKREGA